MGSFCFFCPVIKSKLTVQSEMLDEVGQFTKFILWSLSEGYTINDIDMTIELGDFVVIEEINYLCNIGFLIDSGERYTLTENGKMYLSLIKTVEYVNTLELNVLINCYTGEVQKYNGVIFCKDSITAEYQKLPEAVSRQFFYNLNYSNSREFLFNNYENLFNELNESQIKSINVGLICEKEIHYIKYTLEEIPSISIDYSSMLNGAPCLLLSRSYLKNNYKIFDERIENYRNVIPTLMMIDKFENGLLSDKALDFISYYNEEKQLNQEELVFFLDMYSGETVDSVVNNIAKHIKVAVQLPEYHFEIKDEHITNKVKINDFHYRLSMTNTEVKKTYQLVPFSMFTEERGDISD